MRGITGVPNPVPGMDKRLRPDQNETGDPVPESG